MINPNNIMNAPTIYNDNTASVINIPELVYFDSNQYDLLNEKEYDRFIQDTERMVRNSFEYRRLISFLKNTEGMNRCTFLSNVSCLDNSKVGIELHHTELTLYDIVSAVICKRLHCSESMDIFDVANEIMWLHYMGWVGLIPVCETIHDLIGNQYIFVPTHIIRGNYKKFVEVYHNYIDPMALDALNIAETITAEYLANPEDINNLINKQMQIFNNHATYISVGNLNPLMGELNKAKETLNNRIIELKNNKKVMCHLITPVHG